jgi:hypothetical protein
MLAWFALGGQGNDRQRRRAAISFDKIERAVRNVIIIRAAQLMAPRKFKPQRRHAQRPPRLSLRAIGGAWLRRRLRTHGDLIRRTAQLLAALRNWRALGAELARRRARGLTRLARAWFAADRPTPAFVPAPVTPCAADTS